MKWHDETKKGPLFQIDVLQTTEKATLYLFLILSWKVQSEAGQKESQG